MTLNDLERRNSTYAFLSPNSIALQADYVTVVEDRPIMSVKYYFIISQFQSFTFGQNECTVLRGLSAIAEHVVFQAV